MFANERDNKNYDIFVGGWFSDYNDPLDFLNVMKTGVYDSYGLYSNSEYDSLIDSLTGENDNANALRFTRSWKICWLHRIVVLHRCTTLINITIIRTG